MLHQAITPSFQEQVPYHVVPVALVEDPTVILTGNVIDGDNAKLRIGLPVSVVFDDVSPEDTIPRWRLEEPV